MSTNKKHPKGAFLLILVVMWEYFSYYGMRSLLVLYLVDQLAFSDNQAYTLYGGYTSLIYATPILGGWLADRYLGARMSVFFGGSLMAIGHFVLGLPGIGTMYIALAFLVCGYGLFKPNSIALLGTLYSKDDPHRESAFALLYAGGNLGSLFSPLVCGLIAQWYGWHVGFAVAGIGMTIGLVIFLMGRQEFKGHAEPKYEALKEMTRINMRKWQLILLGLCVLLVIITLVLQHDVAGWVLGTIALYIVYMFYNMFANGDSRERKKLIVFIIFGLFGWLFWTLAQQPGSSVNLFIQRHVDRLIEFPWGAFQVPTPWLQSINPAAVLMTGALLTWFWLFAANKGWKISTIVKLCFGLFLLALSFGFIAFGAHQATFTGMTNLTYVIIGLSLLGCAELFIDPVVQSTITKMTPGKVGFLTGVYLLLSGAFANYTAAELAKLSSVPEVEVKAVSAITSAKIYAVGFMEMNWMAIIGFVACLLIIPVVRWIQR